MATTVANRPPQFSHFYTTVNIPENSPVGSHVTTMTARDPERDEVTYSFDTSITPNDHTLFAIDPTTARITVAAGAMFDYGMDKHKWIYVRAQDEYGASRTLWINVALARTANMNPSFTSHAHTREIPENTPANQEVGDPITASDTDGDALTHVLGGADADAFTIDEETGQIYTVEDVTYDFETKSSYTVTVTAEDEYGGSVTATVTITLTDQGVPATLAKPTVVPLSLTSLRVTWTLPAGAHAAKVRYSGNNGTNWTEVSGEQTGTSGEITDLAENTQYIVQAKGVSPEGESAAWSPSSDSVQTRANQPPQFAVSAASLTIPESAGFSRSGRTYIFPVSIQAADPDGDPITYSVSPDYFSVFGSTRLFRILPEINSAIVEAFDYEAQQVFHFDLIASDGMATDTLKVTVRIGDEDEPPEVPDRLEVAPIDGSTTSLLAIWGRVLTSTRPNIRGYDVQYRKLGETDWRNGPRDVPFSRTEIRNLEKGTTYEVRVQSVSVEGREMGTEDNPDGGWSSPARGTTHTLTGRMVSAPRRHNGTDFRVVFVFSEAVEVNRGNTTGDLFGAAGGSVKSERWLSSNRIQITVTPDSSGVVTLSHHAGLCDDAMSICTTNPDPLSVTDPPFTPEPLSHDLSGVIPGPTTPVATVRAVASSVTEGNPAEFEVRIAGAPPREPLTIPAHLDEEGAYSGLVIQPRFEEAQDVVLISFPTENTTRREDHLRLRYRLIEDSGGGTPRWVVGTPGEAVVTVRDSASGAPGAGPSQPASGGGGGGGGRALDPEPAPEPEPDPEPVGVLENPGEESFQSGIGVISGWVCEADRVEIELDGIPQAAAYGTERLDTQAVCGDTDNGFGLLFNWNLLGDGEHEVVAFVDGAELDRATVTVTTLGEEFLREVTGTCEVAAFPMVGERVTLAWQQTQQNFVIASGTVPSRENRAGRPGIGYLENPSPNTFQSGIGVLSGWVCEADAVEIELGLLGRQVAAYGTERLDTAAVCGDTDNGLWPPLQLESVGRWGACGRGLCGWGRVGPGDGTGDDRRRRSTARVSTGS